MTDTTTTARPYATKAEYEAAVRVLANAAAAYYHGSGSTMDDATYDTGVARVEATEHAHPEWTVEHGLVDEVAAGTAPAGGGDVTHSSPMLSLDKDDLPGWWARMGTLTAANGHSNSVGDGGGPALGAVGEPKVDGAAIAARYEDGSLTLVITRGDGQKGEDITAQANGLNIVGLPATVPAEAPMSLRGAGTTFEVRGEVYMPFANLDAANEIRADLGKTPFANPRNATAGILRNQGQAHRYDGLLAFAAYSVHDDDVLEAANHLAAMDTLDRMGIGTAARLWDTAFGNGFPIVCRALDMVIEQCEKLGAARATLPYGIDGFVVKANSPEDRRLAGYGSRAPRWAVAHKYPAVERFTVLRDITLQVGRTGVITPVAELDAVEIDGSVVRRATLHNMAQVALLDLHIGDTVSVHKAGDIIPRVESVVAEARPADAVKWEPPTACPKCGDTDIDKSEERWRCLNPSCSIMAAVTYFGARDCMDIEGLGEGAATALVEAGLVTELPDLYDLTVEQVQECEGFARRSAEMLVANIEASKSQPLNRVITAIGLRKTGRTMGRRIAAHFGSIDAFRSATPEQMAEVEGISADGKAALIVAELDRRSAEIDRLMAHGLTSEVEGFGAAETSSLPLAGKKVVVSGTVPGFSRTEANELVERLGGKSSGSVSKNTDILFAGEGAGSKLAKAEALGVDVRSTDDLAAMAGAVA